MRIKIITLAAAAMGSVFGLTVAILVWAAQEWPNPIMPVVYLASAFIMVFIPLVYMWFQASKKELTRGVGVGGEGAEERAFKRLIGLVFQALIGVLGLFVVALWSFGFVRAQAITTMKGQIAINYGRALSDSSELVQVAACLAMLEESGDDLVTTMVAGLDGSPKAAHACLTKAKAADLRGYRVLGRRLVGGWHRQLLLADAKEAAQTCEIPVVFTQISTMSEEVDGELMLLQCAVAAKSPAVRDCCTSNLSAQGDVFKQLGLPENLSTEILLEMYSDLSLAAFRGESDGKVAASLALSKSKNQRWVIETGCSLLGVGDDPAVVRGMFFFAEGKKCNVPLDGQALFTTSGPWYQVCNRVLESTDKDVEAAICDAMNLYLVDEAVMRAKSLAKSALRARYLKRASAELVHGAAGAVARASRASNKKDPSNLLMADLMPAPDAVPGRPGYCYRQDFTGTIENLQTTRIETTDCGTADYLPGETLEEYLERKQKYPKKNIGKAGWAKMRATAEKINRSATSKKK